MRISSAQRKLEKETLAHFLDVLIWQMWYDKNMKKTHELTIVEQAQALLEAAQNSATPASSVYDACGIIRGLLKEIEDLDSIIDGLYEDMAGEDL